jgi:formylmethanofuran:tetrahydromethanopterin formyltransferase
MEVIINGVDLAAISRAAQAAIASSRDSPGLVNFVAGEFGGRLGRGLVHLRPERHGGE